MKYVYKKDTHTYKTPELLEALGVSRMTVYLWEKNGRFTPPRNLRGDRVFNEKQFKQIVKEFSPGGKYQWHFGDPVPETT